MSLSTLSRSCPTYYPTCVRKTSVYLPDTLKRQLSATADRTHRSEADLLRSAVEQLVEEHRDAPQVEREPPVPGRLVGVGVGPGAADLLTVRALRALRRATTVVAPCTDATAAGRAEAIVRDAAPDVRGRAAGVRHDDRRDGPAGGPGVGVGPHRRPPGRR